jgi:deoxyribonuclease IV
LQIKNWSGEMILGSHVAMGGKDKLIQSVEEALSYNATTFMIYTGAPQNTIRSSIESLRIEEAKALLAKSPIQLDHIVVHAPYIMNLANPDPEKREFAVRFLTEEIKRTAAIGATQIVLHPGAAVGQEPKTGLDFIVEGLIQVIENTKDLAVLIALETMAGKGTELGRSFEELGYIIDHVKSERLSVCFDTCHTHDAGYDLTNFDAVLTEFDQYIGRDKISVLHINDSKNPRGAQKDRHENIGFGHIGFDTLYAILTHPSFQDVPKILETPYVTPTQDSDDKTLPPYKQEIEMIRSGVFNPQLLDLIRDVK